MNAPTPKVRKIYIAADSLWDLRQGTLARISPDFAARVTAQPAYYTREEDTFNFKGQTLEKSIYERVFARFKKEILKCSLRTEIVSFVLPLCKQYMTQAFVTPFLADFMVQINMYPFELSQSEREEIAQVMSEALGGSIKVEVVYIPLEDLTIERVNDTYASMVMYNYHPWLNCHTEEMKKTHLRDVGLFVPRLYFADRKQLTAEIEDDLKKKGKDIFDMFAEIMTPYVVMQFLPIALFCASTPLNKPEYRQLVKVETTGR
jgi:hypothetical protein